MKAIRNLLLITLAATVALVTWSFILPAHGATAATTQPAACPALWPALWAGALAWLAANWQLVLLAYLVPCALAGLRNRTPGTGVLGFIEAALQWVAVTTPKDSPGTLKLPFTAPKIAVALVKKKG